METDMRFISTRDTKEIPASVSSAEAIKTGLAPDGGLFMPESIPALTDKDITELSGMDYPRRAARILSIFLTDYDKDSLLADCAAAYSEEKFPGGAAPVKKLDEGLSVLELWHGPTCAFKDMALQIMPRLLSGALKLTGEKRHARILVATSGDTGKAALEGYRDVDGIDITVFYPVDGVSRMQKLQMATQKGDNVNVCSVYGNFDDTQNGVKAIFSDATLAEKADMNGYFFSSANSINWGRLAPQIVYYISAYCDMVSSGAVKNGEKINVCVPTGNFGNIFAAYIAMKMGLPLGRLICASNSNCVLTDFINTGVYDRTREFFKTMSPSMDILISSNLERLLFFIGGSRLTGELMSSLKETGRYTVPNDVLAAIRSTFGGYSASEDETAATIKATFEKNGYLIDPHTAVGMTAVNKFRTETGDMTPMLLVSTASPYKFGADVCAALGVSVDRDDPAGIIKALEAATHTTVPNSLSEVLTLPVRFTRVVYPSEMPSVATE